MGTGIFATPGTILGLSGSVGLSLIMWVAGMIIALAGTLVYVEFGTAIPRNGGEKNYLEYVYRRPRFLVTGMYAGYAVLLGWAASNSVAFGEYILSAAQVEVDRWNQRAVGIACVTVAFLIHATALKWGIWLQNVLGAIKLFIVFIIIICGFVALGGHLKIPDDFNNFSNAFEGTTSSSYGVVMSIYNVVWSYVGYSNANYALSETKNPAKTLRVAAPAAILSVGVIYTLVNIAYFAAVPKEEILSSGRLVAASLFRNVIGGQAERALSVFVALSAFGNVLSVIFSQGRIVQELGREGILPFSKLWASNRPFNAPFAGLFEHWFICIIVILAPPPGDAYNFIQKYVLPDCQTGYMFALLTLAPASSPTRSPSSTSSSPAVSSTSTCTARPGTGTRHSPRPSPLSSSSFSPTSTSSLPPGSLPPTAPYTSPCRTGSTWLSASAFSSPVVRIGSFGPSCFPSLVATSCSARSSSMALMVGRGTSSRGSPLARLCMMMFSPASSIKSR